MDGSGVDGAGAGAAVAGAAAPGIAAGDGGAEVSVSFVFRRFFRPPRFRFRFFFPALPPEAETLPGDGGAGVHFDYKPYRVVGCFLDWLFCIIPFTDCESTSRGCFPSLR